MNFVRLCIRLLLGGALAATVATPQTAAQGGLGLIRDTEIENTIRVYVAPLFEAAGLDPGAVEVKIVNDKNLNAFVAGGQRIFIHTGLLMRSESPGQVAGVLAHEIGHITGGHLSRMQKGLEDATSQSILAMILGGAIAVASGSADAAVAGVHAGGVIAERSALAYTRQMEQAADQAALQFLDATGQSARGLESFLEILRREEKLYTGSNNPYIRSHPLTRARIEHVREHVANSRFSDVQPPEILQVMHRRMRGKLKGFTNPPEQTLREYGPEDKDVEALYARAIALSKKQEIDTAMAIMDDLIARSPEDPFFHELKGDLLKEGGRTEKAIQSYERALEILPWAALIRINLANLLLGAETREASEKARNHLQDALRYEKDMASTWRLMATAEGRLGNSGEASLALAEEAMLRTDFRGALAHSERALNQLPRGSPGWLRAQDIDSAAKTAKTRQEEG